MAFSDLLEFGLNLLIPGGGPQAGISAGAKLFGAVTGEQAAIEAGQIAGGEFVAASQTAAARRTAGRVQALEMAAGKNRVQTVIQTVNPAGQIVKQIIKKGRPFIMANDFTIARRVIKLAAQAAARIPKKRVPQGISAQITHAVKDKVLKQIVNGENGEGTVIRTG